VLAEQAEPYDALEVEAVDGDGDSNGDGDGDGNCDGDGDGDDGDTWGGGARVWVGEARQPMPSASQSTGSTLPAAPVPKMAAAVAAVLPAARAADAAYGGVIVATEAAGRETQAVQLISSRTGWRRASFTRLRRSDPDSPAGVCRGRQPQPQPVELQHVYHATDNSEQRTARTPRPRWVRPDMHNFLHHAQTRAAHTI